MKVLLVEDEKRIAQALSEILRQENYEVTWNADGIEGSESLESGIFDIAILDVMLPHKNGFEISYDARKKGIKTPILILTAKNHVDDKVKGLDCGADDYLTKPFEPKELLARLRAMTRRAYELEEGLLSFGDISLDTKSMTLSSSTTGKEVRLSDKEYKAIEYMISNQNQVLSREQLATKIWGYDNEAEYNNVEVYMTFVRKKLSFIGALTTIKAVRGIGYELRYQDV